MIEMMPDIKLHNGTRLRSEDVEHATFWEQGAELGMGPVGGPQDRAKEDRLLIVMRDPSFKGNPITGKNARDDAYAIEAAGATVFWKKKAN
jgi:hypothetical protein